MSVSQTLSALEEARKKIRSCSVDSKKEFAGNRLVAGTSTIVIGGSIAAIIAHYWKLPETLHSHQAALIIFMWHTIVYAIGHTWNKYLGGE